MNNVKKVFHITLGFILIFIGVVGLVLPILNGIILLLLGLILLSFESAYIQSRLAGAAHRHHFIGSLYEKLNTSMKKLFK